ncbi:nucleotidyltransferase domain-containing protein [bacterium]|nr:nucleotidyltransferase domain-containing protein [bacterium]
MVDQTVVRIIREYLAVLKEHQIPASCAVLYGSYARGDQRKESDIDVLVVSEVFDKDWPRWNQLLWELVIYADYRIEPMPVTQSQFETDNTSMIIEMARQEGIVIYADDTPARRPDEKKMLITTRGS